jgi:hypothetical protein
MRSFYFRGFVLLAVISMTTPAMAQRRGGPGFGGRGSLLTNQSVQTELKLTDEQKEKLTKVAEEINEKYAEKRREVFQSMDREKMTALFQEIGEATNKANAEILKPEQTKRYRQIQLQQMGMRALQEKDVQEVVKLTDKQQEELKEIQADIQKDSDELRQAAGRDFAKLREAQTKITELTQKEFDRFTESFSTEQKSAWKNLLGEKFEIKFEEGGRRGREGRPGGREGRPGGREGRPGQPGQTERPARPIV